MPVRLRETHRRFRFTMTRPGTTYHATTGADVVALLAKGYHVAKVADIHPKHWD